MILLTFVSWVGLEANGIENGSHTLWWAIGTFATVLTDFPKIIHFVLAFLL